MAPSMKRLLDAAREATRGTNAPVRDFAEIGERLGVSSAVMTNWKARGISKAGAIKAERVFGCSVSFLLDGTDPEPAKRDDVVIGDMMRNMATLREVARSLTRSGSDLTAEQQAEYLAALEGAERDAAGKAH